MLINNLKIILKKSESYEKKVCEMKYYEFYEEKKTEL